VTISAAIGAVRVRVGDLRGMGGSFSSTDWRCDPQLLKRLADETTQCRLLTDRGVNAQPRPHANDLAILGNAGRESLEAIDGTGSLRQQFSSADVTDSVLALHGSP
jgi:hypothetical protein